MWIESRRDPTKVKRDAPKGLRYDQPRREWESPDSEHGDDRFVLEYVSL